MATKTITLELDAYEKLRKAKRTARESFSSVVRRAVFPDAPTTAGDLLRIMQTRMASGSIPLDLRTLAALDAAQERPRVSDSDWDEPNS